MLEALKEKVLRANLDLVKYGLVIFTWGNVSELDRASGLIVIKPSGVEYDGMKASDMVVTDWNGNVVEGKYKPSSDLLTHLEIYKAAPGIGGITHTHSAYAAAWAQSGRAIPCYGTTHADYFHGAIPCTRGLTAKETGGEYERSTGLVIAESFKKTAPAEVPAILVENHGAFSFGADAREAVHNAVCCEQVAKMAYLTESLNPGVKPAAQFLMDKHYCRKHGANAYYGQSGNHK
ncbi:L-ribulose-5-phosphate 4-epimerase UlaF [Clostridia bacterium]|nr:L-ribulose-5-phosphate 4-epimerase UlaF [Clostridia bacterium]